MVVRPVYEGGGDTNSYCRKSLKATGRCWDSSRTHILRSGSHDSQDGLVLAVASSRRTSDSNARSGSFRSREDASSKEAGEAFPFVDSVPVEGRPIPTAGYGTENVVLRGSRETWEAIRHDYVVPGLCVTCRSTLFAIQDAAYVYCPDCRTVSPMDGDFVDPVTAGIGLGVRPHDLVRFQCEILHEEQCPAYRQRLWSSSDAGATVPPGGWEGSHDPAVRRI